MQLKNGDNLCKTQSKTQCLFENYSFIKPSQLRDRALDSYPRGPVINIQRGNISFIEKAAKVHWKWIDLKLE